MCGGGADSGTSVWKEGDPVVSRVPFAVKCAFEGAVARVLGKNLLLCGGKVVSLQPEIDI